MKFSNLLTNSIIAIICVFVLVGCAAKTAELPRETIVFDYTPESEAASGSANVTFAVVGTQLVKPAQPEQMQLPSHPPGPLFVDFATTITKDFMEVLGAKGFGVRGPFKTYNDMVFPDKEGSDLILTAEVLFDVDHSIQLSQPFLLALLSSKTRPAPYRIVGTATVKCDVNLVVSESLTNERMWIKSISIEPFTIPLESYHMYQKQDLSEQFEKYGTIEMILKNENKFHADFGHALKARYKEILGKIYTYLDPREMTIVKNQSLEIRKRKVF